MIQPHSWHDFAEQIIQIVTQQRREEDEANRQPNLYSEPFLFSHADGSFSASPANCCFCSSSLRSNPCSQHLLRCFCSGFSVSDFGFDFFCLCFV
ncbi:hypothetical protein L195_g014648 [Trifolium pratense]|uniref:Uncharacterized protein n=1 Tax=Trifolium pratense TaxID=57577 RepID=A0A2K3PRI3_TRIPR|nr:hypothetical protein L195_g014648 [Trifolium pratense]